MNQTNDHSTDNLNDADHHDEMPHVDLKGYLIGFVLAVLLTAIPFWLVMHRTFSSSSTTGFILLALAVVQIVVHMIYFLHMNTRVQGGWSMLALLFTVVLVVITISGSVWVLYHLNQNMMPGMMPDSGTSAQGMHDMP